MALRRKVILSDKVGISGHTGELAPFKRAMVRLGISRFGWVHMQADGFSLVFPPGWTGRIGREYLRPGRVVCGESRNVRLGGVG